LKTPFAKSGLAAALVALFVVTGRALAGEGPGHSPNAAWREPIARAEAALALGDNRESQTAWLITSMRKE
jgi:hypothetical protein